MSHPQQSNKCLPLLMIEVEIVDVRFCGFICMYCYISLVSNSQLSLYKPFRGYLVQQSNLTKHNRKFCSP